MKNPGIYKIIFDNKYSWFNNKLLRYRCTIMKEFNSLGLSSINSNDDIKSDQKENKDKKENNEEDKKEDKKIEENVENKNKNTKVTVKFNSSSMTEISLDEDLNEIEDLLFAKK